MAATRGVDAWNKHWKGRGNVPTTISKPSAAYYADATSTRSVGNFPRGTEVTYVDSLTSSYTKAAIQVNNQTYYTNIDNLRKPVSASFVNLKPQAFGLSGVEHTLTEYVTTLKSSINSRQDIRGDLKDYLTDLVDRINSGSGTISGYDFSELPMNDVIKDFGECIGPIYCIKRGLINRNLGVSASSKILIPSSSNERLLDYYIVTTNNRIKVSAKGVGNTNTLKPYTLVPPIRNNPNLLMKYSNNNQYKVLEILHENSMIMGPIKACEFLGIIPAGSSSNIGKTPNKELFSSLIQPHVTLRNKATVTTEEVSYLCESELISYSRLNSSSFASLINDVLNNDEIFFVKMSITNGIPTFSAERPTQTFTSGNAYFRSKHGYGPKSDKLGFKI